MRALLHSGRSPNFIQAIVEADDLPRVLPNRDGHALCRGAAVFVHVQHRERLELR
jgi:hypothetical protein